MNPQDPSGQEGVALVQDLPTVAAAATNGLHADRSAALVTIVRHHQRELARAVRIGPRWRSVLSPQDIVQQTYNDLLGLSAAPSDVAGLLALTRRVARRNRAEALHALRAGKRRPDGRRRPLSSAAAACLPTHALELEQQRRILRDALSRLPEEHRTVLRLGLLQDMSYRQIGEHLGRHPGWVADTTHRAKVMLKRALEPSIKAGTGSAMVR